MRKSFIRELRKAIKGATLLDRYFPGWYSQVSMKQPQPLQQLVEQGRDITDFHEDQYSLWHLDQGGFIPTRLVFEETSESFLNLSWKFQIVVRRIRYLFI